MISVMHFSLSSRDTLDVYWAFLSTSLSLGSAGVPFDLDKTAIRQITRGVNRRYASSFSIATFGQQQNDGDIYD